MMYVCCMRDVQMLQVGLKLFWPLACDKKLFYMTTKGVPIHYMVIYVNICKGRVHFVKNMYLDTGILT